MATARIERNNDRHILNLVDAIDVRATDCGTWGFYPYPTSSTFGAMTIQPAQPYCGYSGYGSEHHGATSLLPKHLTTGNSLPGLGDRARAERRAILERYSVV